MEQVKVNKAVAKRESAAELQDGVLKVSAPAPQTEKKSREVPIETKTATAKA